MCRFVARTLAIYLMCGPDTPGLAEAAVDGGADIVELGFPFSDPLADGPVIRRAAERALAQGMRTAACLDCLAATRRRLDVPLVPMTYASLLEAYGYERFAAAARGRRRHQPDRRRPARRASRPELRRVQLVAPTSTDERIALAAATTDGWLYLVTVDRHDRRPRRPLPRPRRARRARARSRPTCRSTPASASRRPSTRAPRQSSPTGSSSARARSRSPRTGRRRSREYVASLRAALDDA